MDASLTVSMTHCTPSGVYEPNRRKEQRCTYSLKYGASFNIMLWMLTSTWSKVDFDVHCSSGLEREFNTARGKRDNSVSAIKVLALGPRRLFLRGTGNCSKPPGHEKPLKS